MSVSESDLLAFLASQLKRKDIGCEAAMGKTPGWDSMAQVDLILALEQRFNVQVPPDMFGQLTNVPALLEFLA
ncbi:MAG: acyl carrier protein [Alphaproteobacteria bacterium]|nr:acyl carrier protein [Alphaproteobacteria bacterium]